MIIDDKDGSRFTDYRKSGNEGDMYYVFLLIARNPNAVEQQVSTPYWGFAVYRSPKGEEVSKVFCEVFMIQWHIRFMKKCRYNDVELI